VLDVTHDGRPHRVVVLGRDELKGLVGGGQAHQPPLVVKEVAQVLQLPRAPLLLPLVSRPLTMAIIGSMALHSAKSAI
jgi:hypothetical protein